MKVYLYVSGNQDGILVCPAVSLPRGLGRRPDARRRVFISGSSDFATFNREQLRAIVAIAFRDPTVLDRATKAVFYDADHYARRSEGSKREKIVFSFEIQA